MLPQINFSGSDEEITPCLSDLARAVADDGRRQELAGVDGPLTNILGLLSQSSRSSAVKFQCLRVLANACADNDQNRQILLDDPRFNVVMNNCLDQPGEDKICSTATIVLFNFCNDYEPAQEYLASRGFIPVFLEIVKQKQNATAITYCLLILDLVFANITEELLPSELQIHFLFEAIAETEVAEHVSLISNVLTFPMVRQSLLDNSHKGLTSLCRIYELLCNALDDDAVLDAVKRFLVVFTEISGMEAFVNTESDEDLILFWRSWIVSEDENLDKVSYLRTAGLVLLGNLCISKQSCDNMIARNIHLDAIKIISAPSSRISELYSAGGILKNMAISDANKQNLADHGAFTSALRLIQNETAAQVVFTGLGLARLLISNSYENANKLMQTNISILESANDIYTARTEQSVKIEIGRLFSALIRSLALELTGDELTVFLSSSKLKNCNTTILQLSISMICDLITVPLQTGVIPEATVALALLFQSNSNRTLMRSQVIEKPEIVDRLDEALGEENGIDEKVKSNVRTLVLLLADEGADNRLLELLKKVN
ncbi:armadillo-type protein [Lipomyces oligophaga]|uniref:armadillo-type protein n=1 Tax=Lipomyces oligophaga TaxID=45792 RepID=UPI0034CD6947